jgi:hypothetical protein
MRCFLILILERSSPTVWGCCCFWSSADRPTFIAGLPALVSDCPTLEPGLSVVCRTGDRYRVSDRACPSASVLPFVWSLSSNQYVWHIWRVRITNNDIFSLLLSVTHGRIETFLLVGSNVVAGTCGMLIFTSFWNLNRPSFIADCICRRKTSQLLVLWRKESCHLQYTRPFNSSTGGLICDNSILPCLSNSSNILSYLAILNVNLTFSFSVECGWERTEYLALAGQTSSTTCDFFSSWGLGGRLYLCLPYALGRSQVTSSAPDGTTCVVGWSVSGLDGRYYSRIVRSGQAISVTLAMGSMWLRIVRRRVPDGLKCERNHFWWQFALKCERNHFWWQFTPCNYTLTSV